MSLVATIDQVAFDSQVRSSSLPVLVDFRADWCLPCRLLEPVLDELAAELAGRCRFVAVDADANPDLLAQHQVVSLPTLQLWVGGELATLLFGARPKNVLRAEILAALG